MQLKLVFIKKSSPLLSTWEGSLFQCWHVYFSKNKQALCIWPLSCSKFPEKRKQMAHNLQTLLVKCWSTSAPGELLTTSLWYQLVTICVFQKWKIKFQKSASSYCFCVWIGLDKLPGCPAKDCAAPEGHKAIYRRFPSRGRGGVCLPQSPLYRPDPRGGLEVLVLSNWHE